jgi:hypothetical protein
MESEESPIRPRALEDAFNQQPSSDDGTTSSPGPAAAAAGAVPLALGEEELQSLEVVATLEGALPGGDSEDLEAVAPTAPSVAAGAAGEGEAGQGAATQQAAAPAGGVSVVLSTGNDGVILSLAV